MQEKIEKLKICTSYKANKDERNKGISHSSTK